MAMYPTSSPRNALHLYDLDLFRVQKHKNLKRQFKISRRDRYRLYNMLRHNFSEVAFKFFFNFYLTAPTLDYYRGTRQRSPRWYLKTSENFQKTDYWGYI